MNNSASTSLPANPTTAIFLSSYAATVDAFKRGPRWFQRKSVGRSLTSEKIDTCGRTGYTGPTGRTGPCHDPPDPSAYSTYTALPRLAS